MPQPLVSLIAAVAADGGIGRGNALLWRLPDDLRHFKQVTMGCPVVMGRRTWESIGRPLPGRRNVVVTRDPSWSAPGAEAVASLAAALERLAGASRVFVIGGAQLYAAALPLADELVLTEVEACADADTYFPAWPRAAFERREGERVARPGEPAYRFVTYARRR